MTRPEGALALLLRVEAAVLLCALPAALLPLGAMAEVHAAIGLGAMPRTPLVEYLARSLSLLYASWAPILWVTAGDVRRYRGLVEVMGWTRFALGASLFALDCAAGMPWWWRLAEGPTIAALSLAVVALARRVDP